MGRVAYGLCFNALSPDGIDYLAGVEVSSSSGLPGDFSVVTMHPRRFTELRKRVRGGENGVFCAGIVTTLKSRGRPEELETSTPAR